MRHDMGSLPSDAKRKLVTKQKASTDPEFGKKPEERTPEEHIRYGMINLDKPSGPTSHEVVSWVKNIFDLRKVGQGGTLDPKVTGVLPIALEESTKIARAFLLAGKEYVCIMRLHDEVKKSKLESVLKELTTEIYQRPPVKSAVKRELRTRTIYYIKPLEIDGRDVLFKVGCEAGTYIRKLCADIGEIIGSGAHMLELRRTKSGPFEGEKSVTLHDVKDAYAFYKEEGTDKYLRETILPVESAIDFLPKVMVRDSAVDALCHGADLAVPGISKLDADIDQKDLVAIFTLKDELIGLGRAKMDTKEMLIEDNGIAINTRRVLMKPGTYPKMWKMPG
ncbi:RNA-guided pseudouridylation complex pseudouridine synthase subunit Cbf5 [archaeon]|nr:RNA-guided pseudouridylation complex pseudouridine synthase subunit Cbf5 [archaeon]